MDKNVEAFQKRIYRKEVKFAVVGLGYVGLPLAIEFAKKGFSVVGIEVDADRLRHIQKKESYISDVPTKELRQIIHSGRFRAVSDFKAMEDSDVIIICVPTPLRRKYHPNISYIKQAVRSISGHIKKGSLVILESTTYPGTTEEVILPLFEKAGLKHNKDFFLCFSPERIDPGNKTYPVHKIPKIVGGLSPEATALAELVYKNIIDGVVPVSSSRTAEAAKLLENTFRLINIAMIDELAMMAHKMNINIWEVIEAASTKPFGFMPFYPGPGVGGHCLDRNESVFVKEQFGLRSMKMPDFVKYLENSKDDVEVLSFDPLKKRSVFKKVTAASARPYSGQMFDIVTQDGRHLKVTDLHPMFVYNEKSWQLKYTKDLKKGDSLAVCLDLPRFKERGHPEAKIDLVEQIKQKGRLLIDKIRVKPLGFSWREYGKEIKEVLHKDYPDRLPDVCWEYLSNNVLPLKYLYPVQELAKINLDHLRLVSGRGPSYTEIPASVVLDNNLCRLIGYYLSEGCYTKDKSARIRFSFNRTEREYIRDVICILNRLGIKSSIYESKVWNSSCIKVSSNIFGFLIKEVLGCGRNCYDMQIPRQLFGLSKERKKALLAGLLRGDGCVEHFFGKWRYRKNQNEYFHNVNTANISFFTSSEKLFQQLIILLHDLGIIPTFKKRKYALSIFGYKQLALLKDLFDGKKKDILTKYLKLNKNRPKNKTFRKKGKFATVKIKSITCVKGHMVYSLETMKPHSFVTSYGLVVHNCIPKDPLYLYWKAKHFGFHSRFIKLASDIINYMPEYVVERVEQILKSRKISLKRARVLVSGVTYKKDILDLRKSPPLDIILALQKRNISVSYFDPIIPYLKTGSIDLKSIPFRKDALGRFDCVILATDHSHVDYDFLLKNSKLIFDTRNVYKNTKDKKVILL